MTCKQEIAEVLGFCSVEEMNKHQQWLIRKGQIEDKIRDRVKNTNGNIFDMRDMDFKGIIA